MDARGGGFRLHALRGWSLVAPSLAVAADAHFSVDDRTVRSASSGAVPFVLVVVVYTAYQLVTNGREILSGGLWAELALSYYDVHDLPLIDQLLTGDAGYLPLPQRLLSLPLTFLGAPAAVYPYYYASVATFGAASLVATLCLAPFRALIRSDVFRFVLAITLLGLADVNTRAFTNFVYFAVVPLVAVTALALTSRRDVPGWAWLLPVFMTSKPGLLAALPMMVLVALVRPGRFRLITIASVLFGAAQVAFVAVQPVSLVDTSAPGYLQRTVGQVPAYVFGFLGRWAIDPMSPPSVWSMEVAGVVLAVGSMLLVVVVRGPSTTLVLVALVYAGCSIAIGTPVISAAGTGAAAVVAPVPEMRDRLYIGAVLGVVLLVGGALATVGQVLLDRRPGPDRIRWSSAAAVVLFVAWVAFTGWGHRAQVVAVQQGLPRMGISQFQRLSAVLDTPDAPVCVPVDGSWILGRDCTALVGIPIPDPNDITLHGFRALPRGGVLTLEVPEQVRSGGLSSFAIMLRPADGAAGPLGAEARVSTTTGATSTWRASVDLSGAGGLVQLSNTDFESIEDVRSVTVRFDREVDLALTTASWQPTVQVHAVWMGRSAEMLAAR